MKTVFEGFALTAVAIAIVCSTHLPYAPVAVTVAAVYTNVKEIIR